MQEIKPDIPPEFLEPVIATMPGLAAALKRGNEAVLYDNSKFSKEADARWKQTQANRKKREQQRLSRKR